MGLRIILGLIFIVFGANKFFGFIELPMPEGELAQNFMGALFGSGYFYVIGAIEVICGLLLLLNKYTSLALVLLAPVVVNIFLYHALMDKAGLPMGIFVLVATFWLLWSRKGTYDNMLHA